MPDPKKPQLAVHPLLANVAQGGVQPESTIKFAGYVGSPSQPGKVRLYSTLTDLSQYVEFDENAVVRTAAAPEIPDDGVSVWVKASTPVRLVHEYQTASSFVSTIMAQQGQAPGSGG